MLFPSSLISSRRRGTSRFIRPSPGNPFFPSARGPSCDHLRDICRVSRRAFHPGMSQRALHESRAMQWPRQVRRDECETRSNRVSTDNQTQHDNFHRCRSRSIRGNRWSERDRRTRPFKRKTKTLRGEGEVNEGRAMRREEKGKEKGMETEERYILCGHSRFSTLSGNASSLDPRPRGQRKELVNVNLLMASAPGPFWEFRLLFFLFSFFFMMNNRDRNRLYAHPRVCRGYSVEDQRWGYLWKGNEPYRFRVRMENLFYIKRRNIFLFFFFL